MDTKERGEKKMLAIAVILIIMAVIIGGFLFTAGLISGLNGEDWLTEEERVKKLMELNKNKLNVKPGYSNKNPGYSDRANPMNVIWWDD
jgi:hypothetical protein